MFLILAWMGCSSSSGPAPSVAESESQSALDDREAESESALDDRGAEAESAPGDREPESQSALGDREAESGSDPVAPTPGTLRFVVIHDGPELLGSEERAIAQLRAGLARGRTLDASEPTDAARAWLSDPTVVPTAWAAFETVVVLRIAAPRTLRNGRRMTRGLRSVHVLRPPAATPVYALDGGADGPVGLAADGELEWLQALLGSLGGAAEGDDA